MFGMPLNPCMPILPIIAGLNGIFMFMPIMAGLKPGIIMGFIMLGLLAFCCMFAMLDAMACICLLNSATSAAGARGGCGFGVDDADWPGAGVP